MSNRSLLGLDPKISGREQPSFYRDVEGESADMQQGLLGMLPIGGTAKKIGGLLNAGKKRGGREWSDVRLTDRREGLAEKFLDEHGFEYSHIPGKPNTYTYVGDKVKAYSEYVKGGKSGVSVKTFNNPTLKSLRNWMGY